MRAKEKDLAVAHNDVSFFELSPPCADRFDFPPFKGDTGLVTLLNKIVVEGFLVFNNTHGWLPCAGILTADARRLAGRRKSARTKISARRPLRAADVRAGRCRGGLSGVPAMVQWNEGDPPRCDTHACDHQHQ